MRKMEACNNLYSCSQDEPFQRFKRTVLLLFLFENGEEVKDADGIGYR